MNSFLRVLFLIVAVYASTSYSSKLSTVKSSRTATKKSKSVNKLLRIRGGDDSKGIDWRYFAAGSICAACSHGITTPIDVIKTKMQTDPEKYSSGMINAAKDIIKTEGAAFLLAGLEPTVVGYGLEGAMKFGLYETFKKLFAKLTPSQFVNYLLASVVAGAVASIVLCPMEEARIKMVGEPSWAKENLISAMARLISEEGILPTFSVLPAMLTKQVPYTMGKQVSFDLFANFFRAVLTRVQYLDGVDLKWIVSFLSAFSASIIACLSSQPGDMILTASYQGTKQSLFSLIGNLYRQRGLLGFFLGLQARLVHVASIITSQLVLYDIVKLSLGLPVTGSH